MFLTKYEARISGIALKTNDILLFDLADGTKAVEYNKNTLGGTCHFGLSEAILNSIIFSCCAMYETSSFQMPKTFGEESASLIDLVSKSTVYKNS